MAKEQEQEALNRLRDTGEQREERRLRQIDALTRAGLATWDDAMEARDIRRRRTLGSCR